MRKRSSYRPRPVLRDPLGYVLAGVAPLTSYTDEATTLKIRNGSALESLRKGSANVHDLDALVSLANMATALARAGRGRDWGPEIRAGVDAVESVRDRARKWGKFQATPTEIAAIELLADVHDAQLNEVSIIEIERAIKVAKRAVSAVGV